MKTATVFKESAIGIGVKFWVLASLLASIIFLLLSPDPSPLGNWLHWGNYHWFHIPWSIFSALMYGLFLLTPCLTVIGCIIVIRRTRHSSRMPVFHGLMVFSLGIMLAGGFNWLIQHSVRDGGYTWLFRERDEALRSASEFKAYTEEYIKNHNGKWPANLAVVIEEGYPAEWLRYRYSQTPEIKKTLLNGDPVDIDAHSDFAYFGDDLTVTPALQAEAAHIIVLLGKKELREIPQVIYRTDTQVYEYPYPARPIAFADGQAQLVPMNELPRVFAEHNTARGRLGLPEHQINP